MHMHLVDPAINVLCGSNFRWSGKGSNTNSVIVRNWRLQAKLVFYLYKSELIMNWNQNVEGIKLVGHTVAREGLMWELKLLLKKEANL